MNTIALVAAGLAALLHVGFFYLESVAFTQPKTYRRFHVADDTEAAAIKPWALNQGFYNLFIALGVLVGIGIWAGGHHEPARAVIVFGCAVMLGAALVLIGSDRRMAQPALVQGLFPLIAIALIW